MIIDLSKLLLLILLLTNLNIIVIIVSALIQTKSWKLKDKKLVYNYDEFHQKINELTWNISCQTGANWLRAAILFVVDCSTGDYLSMMKARSSEGQNRGLDFSSVQILLQWVLNVTQAGGPCQSWRMRQTGSWSRALQTHWGSLLHLQCGRSQSRCGWIIWWEKTFEPINK